MRVRFQADADLDGLADSDALRIAADSGRILVSQNRRTMPSHFSRCLARERSRGVILPGAARGGIPISTAIEELAIIWHASKAAEWIDRLVWIPLMASEWATNLEDPRYLPEATYPPSLGKPPYTYSQFSRSPS